MDKHKVLIITLSTVVLSAPSVAFAEFYFAGGEVTSYSSFITGAKVDIYTPVYHSIGSSEAASAWVLLSDTRGENAVQVGWSIEPKAHSNPAYFYGYIVNNVYAEKTAAVGPAQYSWHTYQVLRESNNFVGRVAGLSALGSSTANFTPAIIQYKQEVAPNFSTRFIGTSNDKAEFAKPLYYNSSRSEWLQPYLNFPTPGGNAKLDTSKWNNDQSGGYWFVWDGRY